MSQRTAAREEVTTDDAEEAPPDAETEAPAAEAVRAPPARASRKKAPAPAPAAPADRSQLTAYLVIWVVVLGAVAYLMAR